MTLLFRKKIRGKVWTVRAESLEEAKLKVKRIKSLR